MFVELLKDSTTPLNDKKSINYAPWVALHGSVTPSSGKLGTIENNKT